MKIFKKIMLSMLIMGSINSVAFGMKRGADEISGKGGAGEPAANRKKDDNQTLSWFERVKKTIGYFIIDRIVPDGGTILHLAVASGDMDLVREAIEREPEEQRAALVMKESPSCGTAPAIAMCRDDTEMVKFLMSFVPKEQRAALVMGKASNGVTPLHHAAFHGNIEMVRLVLSYLSASYLSKEHRVEFIMTKDENGHTALWYAESRGYIEIARLLAEYCQQSKGWLGCAIM